MQSNLSEKALMDLLNDTIESFAESKLLLSEMDADVKEGKQKILELYDRLGLEQSEVAIKKGKSEVSYEITKVKKSTWTFDEDKIKSVCFMLHGQKGGDVLFNDLCDRSYTVDEDALRIFLRNHPDLKSELRSVIHTERKVNDLKLIQAMKENRIKYKDIKPHCHETDSSYLRMSEIKD